MNKLYTKEGELFSLNGYSLISEIGTTALIYKSDNTVLKLYNKDVLDNYSDFLCINNEMYDYWKESINTNIVDLYELVYDEKGQIVGYTMEYCNKKPLSITEVTSEFLFNIICVIDDFFEQLTNDSIVAIDINENGIIIGDNTIKIIDLDQCRLLKQANNEFVKKVNTREKNRLIKRVIISLLEEFNELNYNDIHYYAESIYNILQSNIYSNAKELLGITFESTKQKELLDIIKITA